jgi:hypothetical protein
MVERTQDELLADFLDKVLTSEEGQDCLGSDVLDILGQWKTEAETGEGTDVQQIAPPIDALAAEPVNPENDEIPVEENKSLTIT